MLLEILEQCHGKVFRESLWKNLISLLLSSSWKYFPHNSLPTTSNHMTFNIFKTFNHLMPMFLIIRFWTMCWLLLTTLWRIQRKNYLVLHRFRRVQQHDCWKPWTILSRILLLFTIPWKRNLLISVISAYNFQILLSMSIEKYSQVTCFLSRETKMVMLLLR